MISENIFTNLSAKNSRVALRAIQELFSKNGFQSFDKDVFKKFNFIEFLRRQIRINGDLTSVLKTDSAVLAQKKITSILHDSLRQKSVCAYSDIYSAVNDVYEELLSKSLAPENTAELVELVSEKIMTQIKNHTFAVAIRGVKFEDCSELDVCHIKLVSDISEALKSKFPEFEKDFSEQRGHLLLSRPCLIGTHSGTLEAATQWFENQTSLYAALLAIFAGDMYETGAFGFHIEPLLRHSPAGSLYVNWSTESSSMSHTHSFVNGKSFLISKEVHEVLDAPGPFSHALTLFQKENLSDIEDMICRSVYWYGDAHRDPVNVMQFIKYWSCIECLVGSDSDAITESLALGLVALLTFGSFPRMDKNDWESNISTTKRLYNLRSRAVHKASHNHVTEADVILMSKWSAGLILNVVYLSANGMDRDTMWGKLKYIGEHHSATIALNTKNISSEDQ